MIKNEIFLFRRKENRVKVSFLQKLNILKLYFANTSSFICIILLLFSGYLPDKTKPYSSAFLPAIKIQEFNNAELYEASGLVAGEGANFLSVGTLSALPQARRNNVSRRGAMASFIFLAVPFSCQRQNIRRPPGLPVVRERGHVFQSLHRFQASGPKAVL